MQTEHRHSSPEGRRHVKDRRVSASGSPSCGERRAKALLREACVVEIPLAPLIGECDRRHGDRRHVPEPESEHLRWPQAATQVIQGLSAFWHKLH